jgi:CBS domain-containing protein
MLVRNILTVNPAVVTADDSIAVAAMLMRDRKVGFIPVVADLVGRRLIGVITDRDIAVRWAATCDLSHSCVGDCMTRAPIATAHPAMDVHLAIGIMKRARVRRLPVTDFNDSVVGIVTVVDIARHFSSTDPIAAARLLEEIAQPLAVSA